MSDKIKCTYDDCFRHFSTFEAMKKHKAKDPAHDYYCKRCDEDCTDDMELLFHQITSQKHVACPICGREFKSESGRDRHVEIVWHNRPLWICSRTNLRLQDHIPKQNIPCIGCGTKFSRASALMAHVEEDQCTVIRREHFERQRAEKEVIEDAWAGAVDPIAGTTVLSNAQDYDTTRAEMNLLDDERAFVNTDWRGQPVHDEENENNGPYVDPPHEPKRDISLSKFPPLDPSNQIARPDWLPQGDDLSTGHNAKAPQSRSQRESATGMWMAGSDIVGHLFDTSSNVNGRSAASTTQSSVNLLDTFTDDNFYDPRCPDDQENPTTRNNITSSASSLIVQPSALNINDPNLAHAHIKTSTPVTPPSHLSVQSFFDPVLAKYICPSQPCARQFDTPQAFSVHLLGPPHIGGPVTCPSCYKRFGNTTSLMQHCESGARKCRIRDSSDFDKVVRQITAGLIRVDGLTEEGAVRFQAQRMEEW